MLLCYLKVMGIVGGGKFDNTGAKLWINKAVSDNFHLSLSQRIENVFTNQVGCFRIIGMNG